MSAESSKNAAPAEKRLPPNAGKGRPAGIPNKLTRDVKAAIEAAFDQVGGVEYLVKQANENPQAFLTLLGKVLPKDMNISTGKGLIIEIKE